MADEAQTNQEVSMIIVLPMEDAGSPDGYPCYINNKFDPAQFVFDNCEQGSVFYAFTSIPFSIPNGLICDWSAAKEVGSVNEVRARIVDMVDNPPISMISAS